MAVTDLVAQAALFPSVDLPDPPADHPYEIVRRDGYVVGTFPDASFGSVEVRAFSADTLERTVEEARALLATHGKCRGAWMVPEAASPLGVANRLRSFGMVPYEEPPLEPRFAAMAAVEPPAAGPDTIEARLANTFEEFQAGNRLAHNAFDVSEDDRRALETHERLLWEIESRNGPFRSFVALIEGEVVGAAAAIFGANAVYLSGGSTRADMRGRGVYRSLVRARWNAAVARGTPALTVGAGRMSRPILERLGFATVGWIDCLLDCFAKPEDATLVANRVNRRGGLDEEELSFHSVAPGCGPALGV